jgi:hypothetical protein
MSQVDRLKRGLGRSTCGLAGAELTSHEAASIVRSAGGQPRKVELHGGHSNDRSQCIALGDAFPELEAS